MKHKKFTRLGAFILVLCIFMGLVPGALAAGEQSGAVKIGLINLKGYASKDSSGSIVGVNAEYAYRIAQYANLKIELVLFDSGPAALTALDNGEIDMMCNVIKTDQREAKYLFTESAVGSLAMCVFVGRNEGRFSYNYAEQLKSMTIGYEKDSKVADTFVSWCAQRGITPNLKEYSSLADIKTAIDTGRLDAGLYGSPTVDGYRTIQNFSPVSYYFVFRKTDTGLKSRVDDAMGSILSEEPLYFEKLLQKYTSSKTYRMEALTANESYYISQHPALSVAVLEGDEPYYCTGRDGTPTGIIPDFFEKISDLTDLSFTYKTYATQDAAVSAVKNGEADILGMYSDGQISSYNSGLRITRAYADVDIVLLTHSGTGVNDVKNCAVKKRSINTIRSSTSNILTTKYVGYDSVSECFDALKRGETDGMLCGLPTATWFSNQNLSAAFSIVTLSSGAIELCAATAYPNVMLCSILSKAISASAYSFSETVASNTQSEDSLETLISRIPPIRIVIVVALLLLLVAFLIWAIVSLRRHQKERVAILAKSAETDRKEAEIAALEKAAEEKNAFFSNISHDMRTPLNAILGFSRLCDQETDLGVIRSYNAKIQSSGALLLDLINDTLTISKAGSGKLQLHLVPVDSRKLVDSIAIPIREEARKKNITFTVDCSAAAERTIMADELGVQKIFLNLLSNSIKYTPEGGHISMRLYNEPGADGTPDSLFTVSDDGIGISEDFLPHLFEPFSQEKQPGYESVGTGLGLSIVKQLVEVMGGSIAVQSKVGCGTTFTVRLHFQQADETGEKPEIAAAGGADFSGRTVLLCEDNAMNREIAVALLSAKGLRVVCAENGEVGVQKFAESGVNEYSAVLMDIRMPVMDGYQATKTIRELQRPDAKTVPIIAMTADAFEDDVEKCRQAGMDGHVSKPIDPDLLTAELSLRIGSRE